ncbi:hypothetical protein A1O7_04241 [Cladophialophora yegresii CBS 114405]|uniref:Uncharacterized protein n=1 Tax=Cladophialophora yegresii CBS 114405 TaxID=1182544 RepID=W9W517_9EURO|nr:uncharacterized protein A1O7_04241 [Cladophialophora yegresii CBS 114405]EXJ60090.1 hypothetical protein A1O7_04241 [Cladophialophora yegresii CBS 114405]
MRRSVLKLKEQYQLSYELPHEAYASHVYPRQSSNGSTVVVYGHEQGLRIVWYAGKGFKSKRDTPAPKVNGTSKSGPMVIDLDDDNEPTAAEDTAAPAEFEEDEEEVDPYAPYRDVVRYIDIPLGTPATRIAVPHIAKDIDQASREAWPDIYNDRIVVAAACSDLALRIISAPLDPLAPEVQDASKMNIQVVKFEGVNSHQQFISDIAITHTGTPSGEQEGVDAQTQYRPQTRSQSQARQEPEHNHSVQWSLLVASISCTGSGLLLVHQIPIRSGKILSGPEYSVPLRRTYLATSSVSAKLSFNTSTYPAERHSSLLVILPSNSTVKIYQVFQQTHPRGRRGSNATDASISSTRSTRTSGTDRGRFLITLLPPFCQQDNEFIHRRKHVLGAKWVAAGRAVIALLEDGEWGIWDLEAVGPTSSTSGANLIRGQGNISGIQGGSWTRFSAKSQIMPFAEIKQKSSHSQPQPTSESLAPMTPSTRKIRSEGLFHGSKLNTGANQPNTRPHGFIVVEEKSSSRPSVDECIILSYAEETIYVPSILAFWKGEAKPVRLPSVRLGGQAPRSINVLTTSASSDNPFSATSGFATTPSTPNMLIQTSHRLILSLNPLSSSSSLANASSQNPGPPSDQTLLASGDLDVEGMDRVLEDMGGAVVTKRPMNVFTKSVGFRIDGDDGDGDVDMMGSPTPAKAGPRITNGRNLFGGETPVPKRKIFT